MHIRMSIKKSGPCHMGELGFSAVLVGLDKACTAPVESHRVLKRQKVDVSFRDSSCNEPRARQGPLHRLALVLVALDVYIYMYITGVAGC